MRSSHITALALALAAILAAATPRTLHAQDSARSTAVRVRELLAPIMAAREARDSLSAIADTATGENSALLEERVWQRHVEVIAGLQNAGAELRRIRGEGGDLSAAMPVVEQAVRSGWPRYLRQLERRMGLMQALFEKRDAATDARRLALETEITEQFDRTIRMFQDLVAGMLEVERLGVDIGPQRAYVVEKMLAASEQTVARMIVLGREQAIASARVHRAPDDAAARTELDAIDVAFNRTSRALEAEIDILEQLGHDATALKVALIVRSGKLTRAIFEPRVIAGLAAGLRQQLMEGFASRGAHWLFQIFVIALTLGGFALLARLARFLVRRAVARTDVSQLVKDLAVGWISKLVMLVGILAVLRQLGLQLAPMLAGLGIAGFVLGFALQDTLANFAAGAMILAYHPYDIGDIIEAGGAMGTVRKMSLVSTTILTFDNQTLVVPNKKMWGDVIRNITAQDKRRVDLIFPTGYESDVVTVEGLLKEIVEAHPRVLREPAPLIKLHQLADSSVNYAVRVWARQVDYWDVYWDITRAVKLRFDEAGIKIPYPQRELHVSGPGEPTGGTGPT
ncbi:MAG TPA: mechanosensitive ion channel family protein [Candidatus Eisenbacteria bacterium]|nr:mechanosensitive ion channel family protein [Candidatus Eisenbacteria bacterium]